MLCFVDESGDTGLKVGKGSSRYFTIALVLFNDDDEANACYQRITLLRRELGIPQDYEFHFYETPAKIKKAFFEAVVPYNFFYLAITINKAGLFGEGFKYKGSFYKYTCSLAFENAKPHLQNAIVVFDESGSRHFKQELQTYLKHKMNEEDAARIKKVKVENSCKNNLIQLADMVCGAVSASLKGDRLNRVEYHRMIAHRELLHQFWPSEQNDSKRKQDEDRK